MNKEAPIRVCRCGHIESAHKHHRRGSDCSLCPVAGCDRFRNRKSLIARIIRRFS